MEPLPAPSPSLPPRQNTHPRRLERRTVPGRQRGPHDEGRGAPGRRRTRTPGHQSRNRRRPHGHDDPRPRADPRPGAAPLPELQSDRRQRGRPDRQFRPGRQDAGRRRGRGKEVRQRGPPGRHPGLPRHEDDARPLPLRRRPPRPPKRRSCNPEHGQRDGRGDALRLRLREPPLLRRTGPDSGTVPGGGGGCPAHLAHGHPRALCRGAVVLRQGPDADEGRGGSGAEGHGRPR
mmetsp:Transcript_35867/g.83629  ORF Transcript_35867/g.83629 Transcript_35867/m.83629 type:complete len:233 (-) Transcript_35867:633-1331(-)